MLVQAGVNAIIGRMVLANGLGLEAMTRPDQKGLECHPDAGEAAAPAARRALAEAEARRKSASVVTQAKEVGGREGPDPARFGDWEKRGIASDF